MKIEIKFDRDKIMKMAQQQKSLMEKAVEETIEETSGKDQIQKGYLDSQHDIHLPIHVLFLTIKNLCSMLQHNNFIGFTFLSKP